MKLNKLILIGLLLLIPLAVAETTLTADKTTYCPDTLVSLVGQCSDIMQVGLQAQSGGTNVWFDQVSANPSFKTSFNPPEEGSYLIFAACQGDEAVNVSISVNNAGCVAVDTPPPGDTGGTGPGGSGGCTSDWDCSQWSLCNKSLQQSRTCNDISRCNRKPTKSR
jgi:hypothetical protein